MKLFEFAICVSFRLCACVCVCVVGGCHGINMVSCCSTGQTHKKQVWVCQWQTGHTSHPIFLFYVYYYYCYSPQNKANYLYVLKLAGNKVDPDFDPDFDSHRWTVLFRGTLTSSPIVHHYPENVCFFYSHRVEFKNSNINAQTFIKRCVVVWVWYNTVQLYGFPISYNSIDFRG